MKLPLELRRRWGTLLARPYAGEMRCGPATAEVSAALWVLGETPWFSQVSRALAGDLERVASWAEATTIFDDDHAERYNANGHLLAPLDILEEVQLADAQRHSWWEVARDQVSNFLNVRPMIPQDVGEERRDFVEEYVGEFVGMLLAEIIATHDAVDSRVAGITYFRELSY